MATRGRHAKDDGGPREAFTGRVRRWTRTWVASREPKSKELKFRRWLQTDERPPELAGPRHTYIEPYKEPGWEPYPKHRMMPPPLPGPAGGAGAGAGAGGPGLKRGKSTGSMLHDSSAVPAASQQTMGAPAPKFKLKITLGPKPQDGAAGAAGAAAGGGGGAQPPAAAAAAPAGGGPTGAAVQQHPRAAPHFTFPQQQAAPQQTQTPSFAHTLPPPEGVAPMLLDHPPQPPQPF